MPIKSAIAKPTKLRQLLSPGHNACSGCGQMIAARTVAEALGPNTIIANATGCLEVTTTAYPQSAWGLPWIHSLFENAPAIASGIRAALDYKRTNAPLALTRRGVGSEVKVVAQGGDGATFDIGFGLLSGMWEREENILYVCYDNEAYMNTGIQASGATPWAADTTTSPAGKVSPGSNQRKKDMIAVALAHRLVYVAQTTAGFPDDIAAKVKKAVSLKGPAYLQILVPCIPGWKINSNQTVRLGKLAADTGLYPILEYVNGQPMSIFKVPRPTPRAEDYLKVQGRFKHLFKDDKYKPLIGSIQNIAEQNIIKYNL